MLSKTKTSESSKQETSKAVNIIEGDIYRLLKSSTFKSDKKSRVLLFEALLGAENILNTPVLYCYNFGTKLASIFGKKARINICLYDLEYNNFSIFEGSILHGNLTIKVDQIFNLGSCYQ